MPLHIAANFPINKSPLQATAGGADDTKCGLRVQWQLCPALHAAHTVNALMQSEIGATRCHVLLGNDALLARLRSLLLSLSVSPTQLSPRRKFFYLKAWHSGRSCGPYCHRNDTKQRRRHGRHARAADATRTARHASVCSSLARMLTKSSISSGNWPRSPQSSARAPSRPSKPGMPAVSASLSGIMASDDAALAS